MTIRLQEMHPAQLHLMIALLPLAIGADVIRNMIDNEPLLSCGQKAICIATADTVASVVTRPITGEVNVGGASQDMLISHRNLNFIAILVACSMALWRLGHRKANVRTLGPGAVDVVPAQGVYRSDAPAPKSGQVGSCVKTTGTDLVHGVRRMVQQVAKRRLIPKIMPSLRKRPEVPAPSEAGTPP
jgi:uncharacterized membrane protein